jgi:hypothetical protein
MPSLLINIKKIKDSKKDADVFILSIAENLNLQQDAFPCKLHGIKIVPTSEAEIKIIILSLKSENSSGYDEMMAKF